MKYILRIIFVLVVGFQSTNNNHASSIGYVIDNYHVSMDVEENGIIHVKETIVTDFSLESHGLYRVIPYLITQDWGDGNKQTYYFPIKNINVEGHPYEVSYEDGKVKVRIGDPDEVIKGKENYYITYDIHTKDLNLDGKQMLYMNVIPHEFGTEIYKASFEVKMPKDFSQDDLYAVAGKYGSEDNSKVDVYKQGNTFYGSLKEDSYLRSYEGITFHVGLDNGYFTFPLKKNYDQMIYISFGSMSILLAIWYFWKIRNTQIVPILNFTAPKDLNSADIGYIIDGSVDNKDMTSLILYWANQGYLNIHETSKDSFDLEKIKEADESMQRYEATLFKKIFYKERVSFSDLKKKNIGSEIQNTKADVVKQFVGEKKVFYGPSVVFRFLSAIVAIMLIFASVFAYEYAYYELAELSIIMPILFSLLGMVLLVPWFIIRKYHFVWTTKKRKLIKSFLFAIEAIILFFALYLFMQNLIHSLIITALFLLLIWFVSDPSTRTKQGVAWLEEILGLKDFILYAEKDRLETLVNDDPTYFYHILPYAYVLGVSDAWAKKFEQLAIAQPTWFYGNSYSTFTTWYWISSMNRMTSSFQTASAPVHSSSGSGGGFSSGGGGFSGGGFGGGGGGRW